ncbi:hypothetical protein AU252_01085 [Pseudarthrobacter sulfonivorans]|uniref:DUF1468 domain-containing protein n=2 Tax=Pseudarthrobacter sulfonivorans TaxID=121292 RepID=A0A0U3PCG5_9MICC|nr:hypothetical protein AU252_01085 [Pseudarthrobacter sulfonivorans]
MSAQARTTKSRLARKRYPLYAAALVSSLGAVYSAQLGIYDDGKIGPGAWPTAVLVFLAVLLVIQSRLEVIGEEGEGKLDRAGVVRVSAAIGLLALFAVLLVYVGLVTACLVFGTLWMVVFSDRPDQPRGWIRLTVRGFVISVCVAAVIYFVIYRLLGAPIPVESFLAGG